MEFYVLLGSLKMQFDFEIGPIFEIPIAAILQ